MFGYLETRSLCSNLLVVQHGLQHFLVSSGHQAHSTEDLQHGDLSRDTESSSVTSPVPQQLCCSPKLPRRAPLHLPRGYLGFDVFRAQALGDDVDGLTVAQDVRPALGVVHQRFDAADQ